MDRDPPEDGLPDSGFLVPESLSVEPLLLWSIIGRLERPRHAQVGAKHIDAGLSLVGFGAAAFVGQLGRPVHPGEFDGGEANTAAAFI